MRNVKVTPLKIKEVDGVLYMHQIVQTPVGVAQIQVAVSKARVYDAVKGLAQRAGVQFSGKADKRVRELAAVTAVKGGVKLAGLCGQLPGVSLRKTVAQAARQASQEYEPDVELDVEEEDDGAGFLRRKKRRRAPAAPEGPEDEEDAPAAAGDVEQNSPEDTNPPSDQPVDVQPGYQDVGPSTPSR